MIISPPMYQQLMHQGSKFCFLVHLLKVTELPSPEPTVEEVTLRKIAEKNLLKVTALYGSKQVVLGDFPILKNECIIDQRLICLLNLSKSDCQSKLHFYIDQACSSGLTGHMAFDLKEFIHEGDLELQLKYPLYANTSGHGHGPILKMTIQKMGKGATETFFDKDNDGLILQEKSVDNDRSKNSEAGCTLKDSVSGQCGSLIWKEKSRSRYLDETRLLKLEGALFDLDEKLKILASACKNTDCFKNSDSVSDGVETDHKMSSPLRSSLHNGICTTSHSEICEKLCTDSDDALDSFPESQSMIYPPSSSKLSRTVSDISWLGGSQVHGYKRNNSTDEVSSDFLCSQSSSMSDEEYEHHVCLDECIVCSTGSLRLYEGINSGPSRSSSISLSQRPAHQSTSVSMSMGTSPQLENPTTERNDEIKKPASRKGPGLLRSLFGAAVVAGVSLLGARNASLLKKERSQSGSWSKIGQAAISDHPVTLRRTRTLRRHYSSRFFL